MKRYLMTSVCMALLLGFTACDSGTNEQTTEVTSDAADTTLTQERQDLLAYTARQVMLQKEFASMAQQQAQTNNWKAYAQDLSTWADNKQQELQGLAQQYNVTLPQQMTDEESKYLKEAREADAQKFDEELWEDVVKAQKDAIDRIDDDLKDVEESDATAFAVWQRNTLKELRAHMEQAAAYELELKNREGGIAEPILEEVNN